MKLVDACNFHSIPNGVLYSDCLDDATILLRVKQTDDEPVPFVKTYLVLDKSGDLDLLRFIIRATRSIHEKKSINFKMHSIIKPTTSDLINRGIRPMEVKQDE